MNKIIEENGMWCENRAFISSIINVRRIIRDEEKEEYNVILTFQDRFSDSEVEVEFPIATLNAFTLKRVMNGKGAIVYNGRRAYDIVQAQIRLFQGAIRKLPSPPLNDNCDFCMPDGTILPKRLMQVQEIQSEYRTLGWKQTKTGLVFYGASKFVGQGIKDKVAKYAGEYDIFPMGDFVEYMNMVRDEILGNVPMEAVMAMAASATVLEYANLKWGLDIPNIIINLVKNSSNGKTTAAKLAVSFGGCPQKSSTSRSFFSNFNSTVNSRFKIVGNNKGFPVAFDELSMEETKNLTQFLYSLANGSEKERMSNGKGLQEVNSFSTTMFMTGEESIFAQTDKKAGIRARVLEIAGVTWTSSAESSKRIKAVCKKNYGFVTPMIAQALMQDVDGVWERKKDAWYERIVEKLEQEKIVTNITERVADTIAIFMVSAEILEKVLTVKLSLDEMMEFFIDKILKSVADESNIGQRAYRWIAEYFATHKSEFTYKDGWYDPITSAKAKGVYCYIKTPKSYEDLKKEKVWDEFSGVVFNQAICMTESVLTEILKKGNFPSTDVCMDEINAFGLLMTQDGKRSSIRLTANYTINNRACTGYKILIPEDECDMDWE